MNTKLSDLYKPALEKVDKQLEAAVNDLKRGKNPEDVLQDFARRATNTIVHEPTKIIRDQDDSDLIRQIIGIENEDKS